MKAQFEEKTFESYFNNELDRRSEIYFPPGQVLEGSLGFDSSTLSKNRRLWRLLGYPFWFTPHFLGISLRKIADEMENLLEYEISNIPEMKANILFQYKRPELITSPLGTEWKFWNQKYLRYDIYIEQQNLLNHIHQKFNSDVLVVYASPCTNDINELVKIRRNIIEHTNFAKAVGLNGHHRNTYINSGTYSIACSEPTKIENINILETINNIKGNEVSSEKRRDNKNFLIEFSDKIKSIVSENEYLANSFADLNKDIEEIKNYELFYSLLVMSNFRQITGCQWIVKI